MAEKTLRQKLTAALNVVSLGYTCIHEELEYVGSSPSGEMAETLNILDAVPYNRYCRSCNRTWWAGDAISMKQNDRVDAARDEIEAMFDELEAGVSQ